MSNRLKLELRRSEIRSRLGEIAALETLTDEQHAEAAQLEAELKDVETRWRAAVQSEPQPQPARPGETPEARELRALTADARLGAFVEAAVTGALPEGREAELQQHYGLSGNQFPIELLEERAVTPGVSDVGADEQPVVQPVFATGDAAFLGVSMPTVAMGDSVYPTLTSRPTVGGPHTDSSVVNETTGAFTAAALQPQRLQASFFYRRTDAMRFAGMSEALRMALSSGLSEAMDAQVVARIVTDVGLTDTSDVDDFAKYRQRLVYSQLDGRFAPMESDVRLLVGAKTAAHASAQYRSNNADDSAIDSLRRISGGVRVSAHVAAVVANKQNVIVRRGMRMDAVAPMWRGVTLINDEVTKASTGEIVVTAVLLAAFKVTRAAGFALVATKHA